VDRTRASDLANDWVARHANVEAPSPAARAGVVRMLEQRVPEPEAAAAILDADGRRLVVVLAAHALYLVWAVPGSAGTPEAARCRRIPLAPAEVELSERVEGGTPVRHWWFELPGEPLVFRVLDAADETLARRLASALGWPSLR
jgi:hypothetical protein